MLTHVRMALIHLVVARAKNLRRTIDMGNARSRRAVSVARRPLGMSTLSDEFGRALQADRGRIGDCCQPPLAPIQVFEMLDAAL